MEHAAPLQRHFAATRRQAVLPRVAAFLVRPRLKLGSAHDEAERHADRVAAKALAFKLAAPHAGAPVAQAGTKPGRIGVVRSRTATQPPARPAGPAQLGPSLPDSVPDEALVDLWREMLDAPGTDRAQGPSLGSELASRIARLQTGGEPLPPAVRSDMEARFGLDFACVRVHADAEAGDLAERLHAHAFTVGEHIAFNRGALAPGTASGRGLLAHELAHVAQHRATQGRLRAPEPAVRRDEAEGEGFFGSLFDAAGDFIVEQGWRVVRRFAPSVEPILREGPINWLRRQIGQAFDGIVGTLRRLDPRPSLEALASMFGGLLARARTIFAALASGDCGPLLRAINELKTFVSDVATRAWSRLGELLQPVGDFFTRLWDAYGAPAMRWLQDAAGDVWAWLQRLGSDIWSWTQPVRDQLGAAWSWIKGQLFGPEDERVGDSSGGVVGWITRKAGEAWDWVKEQTRPVWQPVADAAQRIAALIPPPFAARLAEQAQQLSGQLDQAASRIESDGAGRSIAENRTALANVLPSVGQIIAGVRGLLVDSGQWLVDRVQALSSGVATWMGRLRANTLVAFLADAIGWLEAAAGRLLDWARDQVAALFDWIVQGFDALAPFIERVLDTLRRLIGVAGNLMQLPQLVLSRVWNAIPACIRDPIKNFVVQQILGRIPVFGQFFTSPDLWQRVQQTALEILANIFVDGNLALAAWNFFRAVLRVLGLPPELVVRVVAKAALAIGDVLADPIGFLGSLLGAMRVGFGRFFSSFGTHLLNGFTGWLFGAAEEAGIRPPADLSLRSIFGFVMDVLGITVDHVFERLANRVGPAVVARLRTMLRVASGVWSFVSVLVNEGPAGLWRELQQRLSTLWTQVIEGVTGWITERIVAASTRWLLSLLDVTGITPVINALVAIYNAIESFVQYLRQLLETVSRVLDGVVEIAHGQLERAGETLENALDRALPIVIGFLANQLGFGRLSQRLGELLQRARTGVTAAIDWLIDRAIRLGQAVIDAARRGAAALRNWWNARVDFRAPDGATHALYFRGEGAAADLIVESTPEPFRSFLDGLPASPDRTLARGLYTRLRTKQDEAVTRGAAQGGPHGSTASTSTALTTLNGQIEQLMTELSVVTGRLLATNSAPKTPPVWGGAVTAGYGVDVSVVAITMAAVGAWPQKGSAPSSSTESLAGWQRLIKRRNDSTGGSSYYVRGHLLNHNIGGPGSTWENLTPIAQETNNRGAESMLHDFEAPVKTAVDSGYTVRNFHVRPTYAGMSRTTQLSAVRREIDIATGTSGGTRRAPAISTVRLRAILGVIDEEQRIPTSISCSAVIVRSNGTRQALNRVIDNRPTLTQSDDWARYRVDP